jgi:hypothetical protein
VSGATGDYAGLPDLMRQAADTLAHLNRLYGIPSPEYGDWTPDQLRVEAAVLERPIP